MPNFIEISEGIYKYLTRKTFKYEIMKLMDYPLSFQSDERHIKRKS